MFGVLIGPLFGFMYRLWFCNIRVPGLTKGVIFGLVIGVVLQVPALYLSPELLAELMAVGLMGFVIFGAMNFSFTLTLSVLTAWLEKQWSHDNSRKGIELIVVLVFGSFAVWGLYLLVVAFGEPVLASLSQ